MLARDIQDHRFSTAFRGYDPTEVRQFLGHVAGLYEDMRAELAKLNDGEVTRAPSSGIDVDSDDSNPVESDGADVDHGAAAAQALADAEGHIEDLLAAARSEAQTIVSRANDEAARIVLRSRAESRGKPSAERNAAIDAALAEIPGDPEQAREQARLMISEARAVRERILADLAKRRRTAHVQLEQLRVAREKLLETLRDARRVIEDSSRDLSTAEVEARLAAETAGRRVANEAMPSTDELEAELFGGRFAVSPQIAEQATAETVIETVVVDSAGTVGTAELVTEEVAVGPDGSFVFESVTVETAEFVAPEALDEPMVAGEDSVAESEEALTAVDLSVPVDASENDEPVAPIASVNLHEGVVDESAPPVAGESVADPVNEGAAEADPSPRSPIDNSSRASTAEPIRVVDDLFARLRAERTIAADNAREVLAADPPTKVKKPRVPKDVKRSEIAAQQVTRGDDVAPQASVDETVVVIDVTVDPDRFAVDLSAPEFSAPESTDLGTDPGDVANLVAQRLARAIKRHLSDEQGAALVALRTARCLPDIDMLVGSGPDQRGRFVAEVDRCLADVGAQASAAGLAPVVDEILGDVRTVVAAAIARVRSNAADVSDLPEAIASAYRSWTTDRLDALVRSSSPIAA